MKKLNNLIILLILNSSSILAPKRALELLESDNENNQEIKKAKKEFRPESNFIMEVKKLTSDNKKLASYKVILKEILSNPNNRFINNIIDIVKKYFRILEPDARDKTVIEWDYSSTLWNLNQSLRTDTITINKDTYNLQADNNIYNPGTKITLNKNNIPIKEFQSQGRVHRVKFLADGKFAFSISRIDSENSIIELWDLNDKSPDNKSIASLKNWVTGKEMSLVGYNNENSIIKNGPKLWDISHYTNLRDILHEYFKNIYGQTTTKKYLNKDKKEVEYTEQTGIIKYLLINKIIENYNKSQSKFVISYPRLKAIFKELPETVQKALIRLEYVELK